VQFQVQGKKMSVALLTIGSEILDGRVQDTNSQYMNDIISSHGIYISNILSCDDIEGEIVRALSFLFEKTDTVIVSGGLGPTDDDLTRESISKFFNRELIKDEDSLKVIIERYTKRGRAFDVSNNKQALFPKGSVVIPNPNGTAPGFFLEVDKKGVTCLPGVPKELKHMFEHDVVSWIKKRNSSSKKIERSSFKTFGLPEALVGSKVKGLNLDKDIVVSYRANFPEVQVVLKSERLIKNESQKVIEALGEEYIFSTDYHSSLPLTVHNLLMKSDHTIATAESCTGGGIAKLLTEFPGASKYFKGGIVAYDNKIKTNLLDVKSDSIDKFGAVSAEVALEMARNTRKKLYSSIGISISGIAGPDGGSPAKPVGTFFIGFSSEKIETSYKFFFSSSRDFIRTFSAYKALDITRRFLLEARPPSDAIPEL